jgi:XTP/dITP diphosphohydrolase
LRDAEVDVVAPGEIGLQLNVEEDGHTFLANAQKKARGFADASGTSVLADDSGLVVDALGGEPGVESAHYGGDHLDAGARNDYLLRRMDAEAERSARYVCVICLGAPGLPSDRVFVGECSGRIGREPRGQGGFGYDPIFVMPDGRALAEFLAAEKDAVSHRGRAVREMLAELDLAAWAGAVAGDAHLPSV